MSDQSRKPPVGIIPQWLSMESYLHSRNSAIGEAIQRYTAANFEVPREWLSELTTNQDKLKELAKSKKS